MESWNVKWKVMKVLLDEPSVKLVSMYNVICGENGGERHWVYDMDSLKKLVNSMNATDFIKMFCHEDFRLNDDWFISDGKGHFVSFSSAFDKNSPVVIDELADYIIDHNNPMGDKRIKSVLENGAY